MPTYKDKHGRWRYRFAFNGKRESGSAPAAHNTQRIAAKLEKQHYEKLVERRYTGEMPTMKQLGVMFLDHQKPRTKPLTHRQQIATVNSHIVPKLGKLHADRVGKEHIDALVTAWSADAVAKTINTRLGTLRRMLSLAVEWEIIARVPRIEFLKVAKETPRFLTDAEAAEIVNAAQPQWASMIIVALRTGLRIGELRGLQWNDVDFARRVVQVRRTDPGKPTYDATSPKGNRERTVPLTNDAIAVLSALRPAKASGTSWIWPALLKRGSETRSRCRSEKGCHHGLAFAAKRAGLIDVGWHTLRHTYASHLVMRNIPMRLVQKWLGHASIKETEKYSHLSPEFGNEAANVLDVPLAPDPLSQRATKALPERARERNDSVELPTND